MRIFKGKCGQALGLSALGAMLLAGSHEASAQRASSPAAALLPIGGTREIGVAGNYSFNGSKPYALQGSYGMFISPILELGAVGSVSGSDGTRTAASVGGFVDYYFPGNATVENALVPYVGGFVGYSHIVDDSASLGGQAGVKYFFNPNVALTAEYQYRAARHSNGQSNVILGLSTFFR